MFALPSSPFVGPPFCNKMCTDCVGSSVFFFITKVAHKQDTYTSTLLSLPICMWANHASRTRVAPELSLAAAKHISITCMCGVVCCLPEKKKLSCERRCPSLVSQSVCLSRCHKTGGWHPSLRITKVDMFADTHIRIEGA